MKIEVARTAVVHFMSCDTVIDDFWLLKNRLHVDSPFIQARLDYWLAVEQLFDFYPCDDFYWKHPPTLELPELAESLQEHTHCWCCGFPLDGPVCLSYEQSFVTSDVAYDAYRESR